MYPTVRIYKIVKSAHHAVRIAIFLMFCLFFISPAGAFPEDMVAYNETDCRMHMPDIMGWLNKILVPDNAGSPVPENTTIPEVIENESVGEADKFNSTINSALESAVQKFQGAGKNMQHCDLQVLNLTGDDEFSDPVFLNRDLGINVTIFCSNPSDRLVQTFWGYEADATRVANAFYSGELKYRTGFVAICFKDDISGSDIIQMQLDAADALKIKNLWDDRSFIPYEGWSEIEIAPGIDIAEYEDPKTAMNITRILDADDERNDLPLYNADMLGYECHEAAVSFSSIICSITESKAGGEYSLVEDSARELIQKSTEYEGLLRGIHVSRELEPEYQQFLSAVGDLKKAGSLLWYDAVYTDPKNPEAGDRLMISGKEKLNSCLLELNLRPVPGRVSSETTSPLYPDALSLSERFNYRDSKQSNDISLRINNYGFRRSYVIEGESGKELISAGLGYKFVTIVAEIHHCGYRGEGRQLIVTPDAEDFTLLCKGKEYHHANPDCHYLGNIGQIYHSVAVNRKGQYEGVLIYLIPDSFTVGDAYIRVDLGNEGRPVWKLS